MRIMLERASAANAEIADSRNLIHIDVLDTLADFVVPVEYAAFAAQASARAGMRVDVDLRQHSARFALAGGAS